METLFKKIFLKNEENPAFLPEQHTADKIEPFAENESFEAAVEKIISEIKKEIPADDILLES